MLTRQFHGLSSIVMTRKKFVALLFLLTFLGSCESKGGRGGGGSRGSGSGRSRGKTSSSGSAGLPSPNNGKQSYGWNVGGNKQPAASAPAGAPPAYPGLANRPVSNGNAPPAYSASNVNPPAYNPAYSGGNNFNRQPNMYNSKPGYNPPAYGSTFGSNGLGSNTYIQTNYYGSRSGGPSSFLTNALFFGVGWHSAGLFGGSRRSWNSEEDRRWRSTTKAPYFENKVPGSESYLPAAAVGGAATAFGLASLLPLNVPGNKPLMYCNSTEIAQMNIMLEDNVYSCANNSIVISCPRMMENSTIIDECFNKTMECDLKVVEDGTQEDLYCTNATLLARSGVVCNSTIVLEGTATLNETILNCYSGQLPEKLASFVPTTTTEVPEGTTEEKQLSIGARMHVFFLKLIGKGDVLERPVTTTEAPTEDSTLTLDANETVWIPEALTIAPEDLSPSPENSTSETFTATEQMDLLPVTTETPETDDPPTGADETTRQEIV